MVGPLMMFDVALGVNEAFLTGSTDAFDDR
jgi:hypothetical protein